MNDLTSSVNIELNPLIGLEWILALAIVAALLICITYWRKSGSPVLRGILAAILLGLMVNPSIVSENREYLKDTVLLIEDRSGSQKLGDRSSQTSKAAELLEERLSQFSDLNVEKVIVQNTPADETLSARGTELIKEREKYLETAPENSLISTILITDGQIHDTERTKSKSAKPDSPIYVMLSGDKSETDRRIEVTSAPSFSIVDKPVTLKFKVEEVKRTRDRLPVPITIKREGNVLSQMMVPPGQEISIEVNLEHAGLNHFLIETPPMPGEISEKNNLAIVTINGVRDRMKVLLVSGEPHMGERNWRNILKSDPSVELVHFTILRPPEKQDGTPLKELSLIPFPIMELFERKLNEFDLIVFDRYRRRGVLSSAYLENIVKYVENGGALLEAVGPSFATPLSLYTTPLSQLLPSRPTGTIFEEAFRPTVSELGNRHPVTSALRPRGSNKEWGRWFRLIKTEVTAGDILMEGAQEQPLLVLSKYGEGRVAQLMSDHVWLWGKGFDGGGPQSELVRRVAHWLMKEPELEEEQIIARTVGEKLQLKRQTLDPNPQEIEVISPSGERTTVPLEIQQKGLQTGELSLKETGLYQLNAPGISRTVAIGPLNPIEDREVIATQAKLQKVVEDSGGDFKWISDEDWPVFRRTSLGSTNVAAGRWGLPKSMRYDVTGYKEAPLIHPYLGLLLLIVGICALWWREGRT